MTDNFKIEELSGKVVTLPDSPLSPEGDGNYPIGEWREHVLSVLSIMKEYTGNDYVIMSVTHPELPWIVLPNREYSLHEMKRFPTAEEAVDYFIGLENPPVLGEPDS